MMELVLIIMGAVIFYGAYLDYHDGIRLWQRRR